MEITRHADGSVTVEMTEPEARGVENDLLWAETDEGGPAMRLWELLSGTLHGDGE